MRRLVTLSCVSSLVVLSACAGGSDDTASSATTATDTSEVEEQPTDDELFTESDDSSSGAAPDDSDGDDGASPATDATDGEAATTLPASSPDGGDTTATTTAPGSSNGDGDSTAGATDQSSDGDSDDGSGGDESTGDGSGTDGDSTGGGEDTGAAGAAAAIDQSILLDAAELEALGLGTGWEITVEIDPGVDAGDEAFCGLEQVVTREQLYADGQSADAELEQSIIPGAGSLVIEIFEGVPACSDFTDTFGDAVSVTAPAIAGADETLVVTAETFGLVVSWHLADIGGDGVVLFWTGEADQAAALDGAFEALVVAAAAGL